MKNLEIVNKFLEKYDKLDKKPVIVVIGDNIIDVFYNCEINRMAQEAPLPVFLTTATLPDVVKPGGAANTSMQINAFARCIFVGFRDGYPIDYSFEFISEKVKQVPIKNRFFSDGVMRARWDVESLYDVDLDIKRESLFNKFYELVVTNDVGVVVISDYSKGTISVSFANKIVDLCNSRNIISIIDPKLEIDVARGSTIVKLNHKEATELSGTDNKKDQVHRIKEKVNCKYVLITEQNKGIYGDVEVDGIDTSDNIFSSGAGDCYAGMLALAISMGFSIQESAEIAFYCGCIYATNNRYNNVLTPYLIKQYIDPVKSKIITLEEYLENKLDGKVVFSNGVFDCGCHVGHLDCLRYAKSIGDFLIVGINSDSSTKRLKGESRPIINEDERAYNLACYSFVDKIIIFNEDTPYDLIKNIHPDILVKSDEYLLCDIVGKDIVDQVVLFSHKQGFSSTRLISSVGRFVGESDAKAFSSIRGNNA